METTDRCIHCNALLPETMLVPAYCENCEDEAATEWAFESELTPLDLFNA